MPVMTFSERIAIRRRAWWAEPNKWRNRESYQGLFHRFGETHRLRSRHDSDDRWRCCDRWQRSLNNKWNAREFAVRHGCRVPHLYWHGRRVGRLPFAGLPDRFVIRPIWGAAGHGTYVMVSGRDILHERDYAPGELAEALRRQQGWVSRFPVLVEEFVVQAPGLDVLPTEYKFFMFAGTVGAVLAVRWTGRQARAGYYAAHWQRLPDAIQTDNPPDDDLPPPSCYEEMLAAAKRLGAACGTFMRVDFHAGVGGAIFGEFSSTPTQGRFFTAYGDRYLGDLWQRECPDKT